MSDENAKQIAELNDRFRADFYIPSFGPRPVPGHILCTSGVAALPPETQICIWADVAIFSQFNEDNDPHGEHDFGAFDIEGAGTIFWKIDYYADKSCAAGSENPADPARSFRVPDHHAGGGVLSHDHGNPATKSRAHGRECS